MPREAGDRSDPDGVPELFFTEQLGYSDAEAIETTANLVRYLDTWGLRIAPTKYVAELEAKAGAADRPPRTPGHGKDENGSARP